MARWTRSGVAVGACLALSACTCGLSTAGGRHGGPGDAGSDGGFAHLPDGGRVDPNCTSCLLIDPANTLAHVALGGSYTLSFTTTARDASGHGTDVTSETFFSLDDPAFGSFSGNQLTWSGRRGGTVYVSGLWHGNTVIATLTLDVGGVTFGTPGNFGGPATGSAACNPTLLYPPDGVLLPPNMNVLDVHFTMGSPANNLFELSFANSASDLKIYTACAGATPDQGQAVPGGCVFQLSQPEWDYLALSNRNGAPVQVQVRGVGCDGANVGQSGVRNISFAKEDLVGTVYYWASIRVGQGGVGGIGYNTGGIYRYEFGRPAQTAEAVLTPSSPVNNQGACIGCHTVSREGRKMIFSADDNDGDDEYCDIRTNVYDIAAQTTAAPIDGMGGACSCQGDSCTYSDGSVHPPGFHTWNRETSEFLLSDGRSHTATPDFALRRMAPDLSTPGFTMPGTLRATTPDWSADDNQVVYVVPPNISVSTGGQGYWPWIGTFAGGPRHDLWFGGASLYLSSYDSGSHQLGPPTLLAQAMGTENYYYPSFSPEGSLIAFNYAPDGPNFHNPKARVKVMANAPGAPQIDLAKLNDTGNLTNSWARWSPFPQTYQDGLILWLTFSSTRNYGLLLENDGLQNCYPTESPQGPAFVNAGNQCTRTQVWMAAIRLSTSEVSSTADPSWTAFRLPFQDLTTNNHLAQWAQKRFTQTCVQGSDCLENGCCENGACTTCPNTSPQCNQNANCAPGLCCLTPSEVGSAYCGDCSTGARPDAGAQGGCHTCNDCGGQACVNGACGACTKSSDCCSPYGCVNGTCILVQ